MRISVSDAKSQLTELVRRAEGGDELLGHEIHAVVEGKSVFACVDLGGRRIIKKKRKPNCSPEAKESPPPTRSRISSPG